MAGTLGTRVKSTGGEIKSLRAAQDLVTPHEVEQIVIVERPQKGRGAHAR